MKVAVVVNELNIMGGTHKQVVRLCEYLKKVGVDFTVFTKYYDEQKTYPEIKQFKVIHLQKEKAEWNSGANKLRKLMTLLDWKMDSLKLTRLIGKEYDIVNIHDNDLIDVIKRIKRNKQKVVWQINDLPGEFQVGPAKNIQIKYKFLNKLSKKKIVKCSKKIEVITVNVTKNKERVLECLGRDAKVLYCGVDANNNLITHSPIQGKQIKLLSTGVFFPYRNYETLIAVTKKLIDKGYHVSLDIIGATTRDVEYANKIQKLIDDYRIGDNIKIWGQVDNNLYNKLYNESNIFLFMNIDQSWGLTVFEAMSAGIPTMVSNSVGAIELLHNEVDSIIVDPLDVDGICNKVIQLYSNKEYYSKLSNNGRNAVREFTWDSLYSKKMLNIFKSLCEEDTEGSDDL